MDATFEYEMPNKYQSVPQTTAALNNAATRFQGIAESMGLTYNGYSITASTILCSVKIYTTLTPELASLTPELREAELKYLFKGTIQSFAPASIMKETITYI